MTAFSRLPQTHAHTHRHTRAHTNRHPVHICMCERVALCFCPVAVQNDVRLSSCVSDLRNSLFVSPHSFKVPRSLCLPCFEGGRLLYRREVVSFRKLKKKKKRDSLPKTQPLTPVQNGTEKCFVRRVKGKFRLKASAECAASLTDLPCIYNSQSFFFLCQFTSRM